MYIYMGERASTFDPGITLTIHSTPPILIQPPTTASSSYFKMSQHFYTNTEASHINTARSNVVRTPEKSGPVQSSAVSIRSNGNAFRQRWQTQDTNTQSGESVAEPLIFSPVVAEEILPDGDGEDDTPPPLPPRNPRRDRSRMVQARQYSDFEYGTMCFLALCTFLGDRKSVV